MSDQKYVQITFLVTRETGVISFLMLNGGKLGLLYNKKFEREDNETSHVVIYYTGTTEASDSEVIKSFEAHPGVTKVEDISIVSVADMRKNQQPEDAPA